MTFRILWYHLECEFRNRNQFCEGLGCVWPFMPFGGLIYFSIWVDFSGRSWRIYYWAVFLGKHHSTCTSQIVEQSRKWLDCTYSGLLLVWSKSTMGGHFLYDMCCVSAVARLTRFKGRDHKKFPKGFPLCLCLLEKFQRKMIKGGSIGFFSYPPPVRCATAFQTLSIGFLSSLINASLMSLNFFVALNCYCIWRVSLDTLKIQKIDSIIDTGRCLDITFQCHEVSLKPFSPSN